MKAELKSTLAKTLESEKVASEKTLEQVEVEREVCGQTNRQTTHTVSGDDIVHEESRTQAF